MKKNLVAAVALAFVLLSAGAALAGIAGSKHDMTSHMNASAPTGGYNEVCVYCHTPHSANQSVAQLWNHTATVASYTTYTNTWGTLEAIVGNPGAGSLLCLSCHDGSQAIDSLYNLPNNGAKGTTNKTSIFLAANDLRLYAGNGYIGTDLSNDHPIGFPYPAAGTDLVVSSIVGADTYTFVRLIGVNNTVECPTCHDAHSTTNAPFLRSTNQGSQLCTRCHTK